MAEMDQDQQLHTLPIGERLQRAREAKGMSLEDVATQTRIPIRHLQHIERGEWDALPAVTYSVGFARSYANAVGLNGVEIGAEVREQLGSGRAPSGVAEYYEPADPARVPPRSLAIVAAVIAVLLVAGYLVWRTTSLGGDAPAERDARTEIPLPEAEPETPQPATPPAPATGPVVLTATDAVWIRVTDASGATLFEGTLNAGQSYDVPANAQGPQLRAGRPDALRITVGQTVIPQIGPSGRPVGGVSLSPADLAARAQGAAGGAAPAGAPPPAR